jgi:HK97 family phage portal protein
MGFLADTVRALARTEQKATAVAATTSPYDIGYHSRSPQDYQRNVFDGYMVDELVYQCIELRMNSAGEPPICAYRKTGTDEEKLTDAADEPALALFKQPNPFMDRSRFWQTVVMHLDLGGNAYLEKVRSGAGKTIELWPLRPDRVTIKPDPTSFIGGYTYKLGTQTFQLAAEDVIHIKYPHPLDDFYGLSKLQVLAGRVDLDVWTRKFTEAFFRNAGVPAGLLSIQKQMSPQEREDMRRRFRELYGGEQGWHKVLVVDTGPNQSVSYTPMGLPLGENGLGMNSLQQQIEAKICGVFGVPMSLIPTLVGAQANRGQTAAVSDREVFWEQTMIPLFKNLDAAMTMGLADEYPDIDRFEHDLSTIAALQEDQDKLHARWRDNWSHGLCTWEEARQKIGLPEEPDEEGVVMLLNTSVPTPSNTLTDPEEAMLEQQSNAPQPQPQDQQQPQPDMQPQQPMANGRTNGVAAH